MVNRYAGLKTVLWVLILGIAMSPAAFAQGKWCPGPDEQGQWWQVTPEEEVPSEHYDSILYSEIAPKLRKIIQNSDRVKVRVFGRSAGGRNMYLAAVAAPGEVGRFGYYKQLRRLMIRDPEMALAIIERFDDFKVPVFINGSIHGDEYPGTDASIRLLEKLAYDDSEEVRAILDNIILLVNVVQNPDGRVQGTRYNANHFDLNRDLITQSQPETRALVRVVADWNPMVFLDLHGFVSPMLIEPCTPPHNPNYEYDLYLKWALNSAKAMAQELYAQTDETEVIIPYLTWPDGWDDWSPIYAAMYPMLHGSYGHTLETPHEDIRGVDAQFAAVWGDLKFVVANKKAMIRDQIEIYRRGLLDLPQTLIPEDLIGETPWEQFNELTIKDFPEAYIIPVQAPLQENPYQAAELIDFLVYNGVQVSKALRPFNYGGKRYARGDYIVWMDQPKRALANTILEDGMDVSGIEGLTFYSPPAAWSHPLLWGVSRTVVADDDIHVRTRRVRKAERVFGTVQHGHARAYAFELKTLPAFKAVNDLIDEGYPFYRAKEAFSDKGRQFGAGTIVMPPNRWIARKLARQCGADINTLRQYPGQLVVMEKQRIAAYGDEGLSYCLSQLGFDYTEVSADELNAGVDLSGYDLLIHADKWWTYALEQTGIDTIKQYCANGGDFIGIGSGGALFAAEHRLIDAVADSAGGNGIVDVTLDTNDAATSGFTANSNVFVYDPVWFPAMGDGVDASVSLAADNLVRAGYWPGWKESTALGMPILVSADEGPKDTLVMGFDATFRGHPKNTFKFVGNAVYSGLDVMREE